MFLNSFANGPKPCHRLRSHPILLFFRAKTTRKNSSKRGLERIVLVRMARTYTLRL